MADAVSSSEEDEESIFSSSRDRIARWRSIMEQVGCVDPLAEELPESTDAEVKRRKKETRKRQGRFSHNFARGDVRAFRFPTDRSLFCACAVALGRSRR